jgi:ClpP class serine protease
LKQGLLAIRRSAWGLEFLFDDVKPEPFKMVGETAVVSICGPLTHHAEWFCDSYDAIKERVRAAFDSAAKSVVLEIDSPGGDVSGVFETSRELRAMAEASGKPLYAIADGICASAAYSLACAAEFIACPETSFVGSIGVIEVLMDHVAADKAFGLNVAVIASGEHKADGHPCTPLTEGALIESQKRVDSLAEGFFAWVADARGSSADAVRGLEAKVFHGNDAVAAGLADRVMSKEQLLGMISSGETRPSAAEGSEMGWKDDMKKAAEDGDEEAKKALAALEEDDAKADDPEKKDDAADPDKKDEAATAAADPPEKKDDKKPTEKKAEGDDDDAKAKAAVALGDAERRIAALEQDKEDQRREKALVAAHGAPLTKPGSLTPGQMKLLREEKSAKSFDKLLSAITDGKPAKSDPNAVHSIRPTRGATQVGGMNAGRSAQAADIAERMGFPTQKAEVHWNPSKPTERVFPQVDRATAKAMLAERERLEQVAASTAGGGK